MFAGGQGLALGLTSLGSVRGLGLICFELDWDLEVGVGGALRPAVCRCGGWGLEVGLAGCERRRSLGKKIEQAWESVGLGG